jgi:hypothetical protein
MSTLTFKIGRTSMARGEHRCRRPIILDAAEDGHQVLTVVSAMSGVTNQLLDSARAAAEGRTAVYLKHADLRDPPPRRRPGPVRTPDPKSLLAELHTAYTNDFQDLCRSVAHPGRVTNRGLDATSPSESGSAPLAGRSPAGSRRRRPPVDATKLIVTTAVFQMLTPLLDRNARPCPAAHDPLSRPCAAIVTASSGDRGGGITTTLGAAGSDIAAPFWPPASTPTSCGTGPMSTA